MSKPHLVLSHFSLQFVLFSLCYFIVLFSCFGSITTNQLPACQITDYKYDFTECDAFGGRWRVSVPTSPDKCTGGAPNAPIRVNKCFTSCEAGQFFNMTSLLCQDCAAGHYSLGGGIIIDSFNDSLGKLPSGFRITTQSTKHSPELNKKCNGWFVDPVSGQLVSVHAIANNDNEQLPDYGIGCVSIVTYTVKVVKSGRLRFTYHYQIPSDVTSSLLFTFNYHLYGGESNVDDDSNSNIRFPVPTVTQNFDTVDVTIDRPGLYVFSWKSVLIGSLRGLISSNRRNSGVSIGRFGNFVGNSDDSKDDGKSNGVNLFQNRLSSGMIRIKNVIIEGVAYASECSPCDPGTFASNVAMRECEPCPANTAFAGFGANKCQPCDQTTEYSSRGSSHCRKRPVCGANDFYSEPLNKCDPVTKQQKVQYKWIEPRICIDTNHVFPNQDGTVNCTSVEPSHENKTQCDLGMELKGDGVGEFCQFCPATYFRCEKSATCQPCPPFTSPYYALSIFKWNNSLPSWSNTHYATNFSSILSEDYFADNNHYLNAYFSRQCIRSDDTESTEVAGDDKREQRSYYYKADSDGEDVYARSDECDARVAWQPFLDHIRTGASALLDSYLVLSISIPGFRSIAGGEVSFVFETHCAEGDRCTLLFVETKNDESDLQLQELSGKDQPSTNTESRAKRKFLNHPSVNEIIKDWSQSSDGRQSYRYKIDGNVSVTYSWVFKRATSFQSFAKLYSVLLTNSLVGAAIECKSCPFQSESTPNQCVTCPDGQYLQVSDSSKAASLNASLTVISSSLSSGSYQCRNCPANHVLNRSVALPLGAQSCLACGPNLITDERSDLCFSNCTLLFGEDYYDLRELQQPLQYRGGNLFTAGGTQYMHLFKISFCGHPKHSTRMATCLNNITAFADDASTSSGVRSFICRSTIIPDGSQMYATQSVSLGDELLGISRESTFRNISVHGDFLKHPSKPYEHNSDYHLFFSTKTATTACPAGRGMTITMRCAPEVEKTSPGKAVVSTPKSCPDGTCDGCNFHLLIETGTAAACRVCRPYSTDYDTLVGECIDGLQDVHFINPKGCVIKKIRDPLSGTTTDVLKRPCSILLPRQVQIGISFAVAFGLVLLMLVFYFWNQNRSLEYKYTKLIESAGDGKDGDLSLDNCCVEDVDDEEIEQEHSAGSGSSHQIMFSDDFDRQRDIPKENRKQNNRLDKGKRNNFGSSREMQQLFSKPPDQSTSLIGNGGHRVDDEGYETIHLTSASSSQNQIA